VRRDGERVLVRVARAALSTAPRVLVLTRRDRAARYRRLVRDPRYRVLVERAGHPYHPAEGVLAARPHLPEGRILLLAGDLGWLDPGSLGEFVAAGGDHPVAALWRRDGSLDPTLAIYERRRLVGPLSSRGRSPLRRMSDLLRAAPSVLMVPAERILPSKGGHDPFQDVDRPTDLRPKRRAARGPRSADRRARIARPPASLFRRGRAAERAGDRRGAAVVYREEAVILGRAGLPELARHARRDALRARRAGDTA
jgi:molybdopterin-guanine dinucleotide biosynthesis protein A